MKKVKNDLTNIFKNIQKEQEVMKMIQLENNK